jgi:phenylalanyl-tRNA synthetase beta chain
MNISYNWLKDYIKFNLSPEALKERLTFSGIEVEKVEKLYENLKQIKVAKIIEREKHPNADKLSVCKVDDGEKVWQVICGAPNCDVNQLVAFAPIGSQVGEIKIKKAKLRGVESYGMLCAEDELGLSNDHSGIMILDNNANIGDSLADYLHLSDTVYEVEITPNRPDLLGMIGIARDLSALLDKPLQLPNVEINEIKKPISESLKLINNEPSLCTRYTARLIKNVKVKESPEWLKRKLISVGLRPINNIVDITNFVMMEYGHPLHAFDYDKVKDHTIIVRKAEKGEKFPALDDNEYELNENDLVIADSKKPIALAGVIGGNNSHITEDTTNIVIEAANFLYSSIRKTSLYHKIFTDSSYRFERNLSDVTPEIVSKRAAQLVLELAGGELYEGVLDSYPEKFKPVITSLRPSRVEKVLGLRISEDKIISYLTSLGLKLIKKSNDKLDFEIPHYRKDLPREIDLIEEIIRLHGYDNLPKVIHTSKIMDKESFYLKRTIQDLLVKYGFFEVVNWSFGDPEDANRLNIPQEDIRRKAIKIKNPIGQSFSIMRTMLLPDILKNAIYNINHGEKDLKLFEMNKVFFNDGSALGSETLEISGIITGNLYASYWKENTKTVDFFDLKGMIEDLLETVGIKKYDFNESRESFYQPGLSLNISSHKPIGHFGKIDPKVALQYDIEQPVFAFTINFDVLKSSKASTVPVFQSIPKFPSVIRDISFIVSKEFAVKDIIGEIKKADKKTIKRVVLIDEYYGKGIEKSFRSLTFSIVLNSEIKTLTDEYVKNVMEKIMKNLKNKFSVKER